MQTLALPWSIVAAMSRDDDATPVVRPGAAREAAADAERIEALYAKVERAMTNVLYRWLWSREDVRDVLQEAFVRLWEMRARVDWERVEPLVYRIALNLASKRRRSRKLWQWVALDAATEPAATATTDEIDAEQAAAVRRAIDQLSERHRRVLVLSLNAELGYTEIADILGISIGTVASRRNTAVAKLKAALESWEASR